jgi:4-amino-4-deoxy-L-arabinose transferase-like glycosyltransferase
LTAIARRTALWALAVLAITVVVRLPALLHRGPIDDEAMYAVVANEIVDGGRPYVDAVERKPPLLFWTYAAIVRIAGKYNWPALHAASILWTLATLGGLYLAGRRLFDVETGIAAALLYSVFQPWGTWKNLALNGEVLMNLPLAWAWAIAFGRISQSGRRFRMAAAVAGALVAMALLLKQPAAIAALPMAVYLWSPAYGRAHVRPRRDSALHVGLFITGLAATLGAVVAVLYAQQTLGEAFYWTVLDHDVPIVFWTRGALHTVAFLAACLPLWAAAAAVVQNQELWKERRAERTALLAWLAVSVLGTVASGRFYPHYYIQIVLPLSLLAAPAFARIIQGATFAWLRPIWAGSWLTITACAFAAVHWWGLGIQGGPTQAGQAISARALPDDRIFVWGQAPRVYLDAKRRPASRYITTFPLTGYVFGGPTPGLDSRNRILPNAWPNLEHDFHRHRPQFVVDVQATPGDEYPIANFPILSRLVRDEYHVMARTREGVVYERNSTTPPVRTANDR